LSGPEYAARFIDEAKSLGIEVRTGTSVLELTQERLITAASRDGLSILRARSVILAMGCRERTREAIRIPGTRPAGVYTAGVAQAYMNLKNIRVGRKIVILGSGDIGLIMARRFTLEGASVQAVFEVLPYPSGLPRNIEQCLLDFDIPLRLGHTVTKIHGKERLEGVTVSRVDDSLQPVPGSETYYACDTLILSVGLIPENELSEKAGVLLDPRTKGPLVDEYYQTGVPGIFAAGNVLQVHDLVDFVSAEAEKLAESVSRYLREKALPESAVPIEASRDISYTVPSRIGGKTDWILSLRVREPRRNIRIELIREGKVIKSKKFRKALPAEMIRIPVSACEMSGNGPVSVVIRDE
jgi:NADPH-dependent 2,4-dienoyl-CoA reductase/sulfur reductase-like enzyme